MAAFMKTVFWQINRLGRHVTMVTDRHVHTAAAPLCVQTSHILQVKKAGGGSSGLSPLEIRKRRRLEKEIKQLTRQGRRLKPVDEIETQPSLRRQQEQRAREQPGYTYEEMENKALLYKEWSLYRKQLLQRETTAIQRAMMAQEKALRELRQESEELYQQAIQTDDTFASFQFSGPVSTPPIKNFDAEDGDYVDVTRTFSI